MNHPVASAIRSELIDAIGPWPFITCKVFERPDGVRTVLHARHHRKGLIQPQPGKAAQTEGLLLRCLWLPGQLNWWIGVVFALGSTLFALGSVMSLAPALARSWSLSTEMVNAIYFAGSIPFTTAAYLQLHQAANAPEFATPDRRVSQQRVWFGWRPRDIGWVSCALQFVGTLLFNLNTFDGMLPGLNWFQQDLLIWGPDVLGSVLFLASGHLALLEVCHSHWVWKPHSLSWWVTFTNWMGCLAFMVSAVFAFARPHPLVVDAATISVTFTLVGAIGFLVGSLLMLPETATVLKPPSNESAG